MTYCRNDHNWLYSEYLSMERRQSLNDVCLRQAELEA